MTGTDMAMWLPKTAAREKPTSINTGGKEGRKGKEGPASRDTQTITHKERPPHPQNKKIPTVSTSDSALELQAPVTTKPLDWR